MDENTQEQQTNAASENGVLTNEKQIKKKKLIKNIPLFILEICILVIAIVVLYVATRTADSVERVDIDTDNIPVNESVKEKLGNTTDTEERTGYYNVALFGVDSREGELGKGNRSDTIMICSVNMDTHEVRLISIYRDTYLNLGNDSYNKCNAAYAQGGPEQAIGMINMNTDMYVTDYVTIGFAGLIDAVDALGGVELEVTEAEISHLNNYQLTMADELGVSYTPVTETGRQTLNGLQATAYCRIRYTAGDDFKRAERQRDLLTAMMEKAKTASIGTLNEVLNAVLPQISTSLNVEDIVPMLGMIGNYEMTVSDGFPFATNRNGGKIGSKGSCVVPTTLEENVILLHELLFPEEGYTPSKELKEYSAIIEQDTDAYLEY